MEELWYRIKNILVRLIHLEGRSRVNRYIFPLLLTVVSLSLKAYFLSVFGIAGTFLLLTLIVMLSSWYGGLGPGVFSTFLSATLNFIIFLRGSAVPRPLYGDILLSGIFILEGVFISVMSEARYEYERQKDDFIGLVAHELKNPLSSIRGFAQLIALKSKRKKSIELSHFAQQISSQSERMLELINDLLDITKLDVGKFSFRFAPFEIESLIEEVVSYQQVLTKGRKIICQTNHKKVIYADRYRIGQVITNLLTNALKYSPEKSPVTIASRVKGGKVVISVSDKGIGIPKEDQDKVFSEFYRTNKAQGGKAEGLGLGLYITSQIIKRHKGKIWVKSKESKGSTFYIELPIQ